MWLLLVVIIGVYLLLDRLLRLPKVRNLRNKYVFVTGCDSGFGRELAVRLDKLGLPVFAACLTPEGKRFLEDTCSSRVAPLTLDVADTTSIQQVYEAVRAKLPDERSLWAVVNNAGTSGSAAVTEMLRQEDILSACRVNLFGPIEVSRVFMPLLRKSQGRLVLMTSIMGRCPATPVPYAVSKFGLEAFGDVVRREVSGFGVKVSLIEPGYFQTNIIALDKIQEQLQKSFDLADAEVKAAYGKNLVGAMKTAASCLRDMSSPDTHKVVDAYVSAISSRWPRARYVVGNDARFFFLPLSWLPEWLSDWVINSQRKRLVQKYKQ